MKLLGLDIEQTGSEFDAKIQEILDNEQVRRLNTLTSIGFQLEPPTDTHESLDRAVTGQNFHSEDSYDVPQILDRANQKFKKL